MHFFELGYVGSYIIVTFYRLLSSSDGGDLVDCVIIEI